MQFRLKNVRGPKLGSTVRIAAVTFVFLMMVTTLIPMNFNVAKAADCPAGQVLNSKGECVPLLNLGDGSRILNPDLIVTPTQTPAINIPVIDVDVSPTPTSTPIEEDPQVDTAGIPLLVSPEPEEPASLVIGKYACPDGYDPTGKSRDELFANCSAGMNGVTFLLSDGQSAFLQQTTGDVLDDTIVFLNQIPLQPISIVEQIPSGYGAPIVFCSSQIIGGSTTPYAPQTVDQGNQIFHVFQAREGLSCDWFNIPGSAGDSTVTVYKYACPADYNTDGKTLFDLTANCQEAQNDVEFSLQDGANTLQTETTGTHDDGAVRFENVPATMLAIVEDVPAGFGEPIVYCNSQTLLDPQPGDSELMPILQGDKVFWPVVPGESVNCTWFNVPTVEAADDSLNKIEISKRACPVGTDTANATEYDLSFYCQDEQNGVAFTLTDGSGASFSQETGEVMQSGVIWDSYTVGDVTISEQIPGGFVEPVVFCTIYDADGPNQLGKMPVSNGSVSFSVAQDEQGICNWYNVPSQELGSITVYKFNCSAGYDVLADSADPVADCPDAANGISFVLDQPQGVDLQTQTGDAINGAVYFGGLVPGNYTVTEQIPDGIADVFVLDCTGSSAPLIQGYPLVHGNTLTVDLLGGDDVVCRWYNVPAPAYGQIVIEKYYCQSATFIDEDLCQIYELGAEFAIQAWNGNEWIEVSQGKSNANGYVTFADLAPGSYTWSEFNGNLCYSTASRLDLEGNLLVVGGEITKVTAYNCGVEEQVTKQPIKYPNTGVGPSASAAPAALAAPASPQGGRTQVLRPDQWAGVFDSRLLLGQVNGVKPVELKISSIGVDAKIEVLETVNGVMQSPTTADQAAWYKETGRLGAGGNLIIAGHLNYWGVPEGVFFRLDHVHEGDVIEVTGDDGNVYRYQVMWVKNYPSAESPPKHVVGGTSKTVLTLITCGGEWNAGAAEYDERTVVRAHLIEEEGRSI